MIPSREIKFILKRSDLYIGSTQSIKCNKMIALEHTPHDLLLKQIMFEPGLYKLFDEILVYAAHKNRGGQSYVRVGIDKEIGSFWVENDGDVVQESERDVLVPEVICGKMDGSDMGIMLCKVFSKEFTVECCDGKNLFKQTFRRNGLESDDLEVMEFTKSYTKMILVPDFEKLGISELSDDMVALFRKRAIDIAGCNAPMTVYFNEEAINFQEWEDYVLKYLTHPEYTVKMATEKITDGSTSLEVTACVSGVKYQHVSFLNNVHIESGGSIVEFITKNIIRALKKRIMELTNRSVKSGTIRSNLHLFINVNLANPKFESHLKDRCVTNIPEDFYAVSDSFINQFEQCAIIDSIMENLDAKSTSSQITDIPRLLDAKKAGGDESEQCTLILTEGDAMKTLVLSGLSTLGTDYFGIYPLKGKLLNVRSAPLSTTSANTEVINLMKILNLNMSKSYQSKKKLRYGKLLLIADTDPDGDHIKGLVLNLFHCFWPSLLEIDGFIYDLILPSSIAVKGEISILFNTKQEYEIWNAEDRNDWNITNLHTFSSLQKKEVQVIFSSFDVYQKKFLYDQSDSALFELIFSRNLADKRKQWVGEGIDEDFDYSRLDIPIGEFLTNKLKLYSLQTCRRSIPDNIDGLMYSQRKVIYGCWKRQCIDNQVMNIAQLTGYISDKLAYLYGEHALLSVILSLGKNYVGSNNINLLEPIGNFGSRLSGKDSSPYQYLSTCLSDLTRLLLHPDDIPLLDHVQYSDRMIEPEFYLPILPIHLINGAIGIATGWSTSIPSFNPVDIANNIKRLLREEQYEEMIPWYRGFTGEITMDKHSNFTTIGSYQIIEENKVRITELPIGQMTEPYISFLQSLVKREQILEYIDYSTTDDISIEVIFPDTVPSNILVLLKLKSKISTRNLTVFTDKKKLFTYNSVEDLFIAWFNSRRPYYTKRKERLLQSLTEELILLNNQNKFVESMKLNEHFNLFGKEKSLIEQELHQLNYDKISLDNSLPNYDYLIHSNIRTAEDIDLLHNQTITTEQSLKSLQGTLPDDLWLKDIEAFLTAYHNQQ